MIANNPSSGFSRDQYRQAGYTGPVPILARKRPPPAVRPTLQRLGEAVFFNEATLHGSDANSSEIPRLAYAVRFTTPEVKFDADGWKEIGNYYLGTMLVRGEDGFHYNDFVKAEPPPK